MILVLIRYFLNIGYYLHLWNIFTWLLMWHLESKWQPGGIPCKPSIHYAPSLSSSIILLYSLPFLTLFCFTFMLQYKNILHSNPTCTCYHMEPSHAIGSVHPLATTMSESHPAPLPSQHTTCLYIRSDGIGSG
jgi:hypothetical protein